MLGQPRRCRQTEVLSWRRGCLTSRGTLSDISRHLGRPLADNGFIHTVDGNIGNLFEEIGKSGNLRLDWQVQLDSSSAAGSCKLAVANWGQAKGVPCHTVLPQGTSGPISQSCHWLLCCYILSFIHSDGQLHSQSSSRHTGLDLVGLKWMQLGYLISHVIVKKRFGIGSCHRKLERQATVLLGIWNPTLGIGKCGSSSPGIFREAPVVPSWPVVPRWSGM